jgi:hypothetical protein
MPGRAEAAGPPWFSVPNGLRSTGHAQRQKIALRMSDSWRKNHFEIKKSGVGDGRQLVSRQPLSDLFAGRINLGGTTCPIISDAMILRI